MREWREKGVLERDRDEGISVSVKDRRNVLERGKRGRAAHWERKEKGERERERERGGNLCESEREQV